MNNITPLLKLILCLTFLIHFSHPIHAENTPIKPIFLYNNHAQEKEIKNSLPIHHYTAKNINIYTAYEKIKTLFPNLPITTFETQQILSFKSSKKEATKIYNLLKQWDRPPVQIRFYIHIYEIATESLKNNQNLLSGLSNPISIEYNLSKHKFTPLSPIISQLHQLESSGNATLLAHPMIATTLLHEAEIRIGDKLPYTSTLSNGSILSSSITQMDTGLHVKIKPLFINDTQIYTTLEIKVETIKVWKQINTTEFPVLSERFVKTDLLLTHKQPFIIAGLTQENKKNNTTHPSLLKSIPLLRTLSQKKHQNTSKTDLIIIIVPEIITPRH
jgi:type II secretory pathway component HofQ